MRDLREQQCVRTEARHRICGAGFFLSAAMTAAQCFLLRGGERKKHRVMGTAALHPCYGPRSRFRSSLRAQAKQSISPRKERRNGLLRRDRSSPRRRKRHRTTLRNPHVMGIAALHPSYRLLISFLNRDAVGWVEHLRNPSPRRFAFDYNFEPTRGPAVMRGLL